MARRLGRVPVWPKWSPLMVGPLVIWAVWERPDVAIALFVLGVPFTVIEFWRPLRSQPPAVARAGGATDATGFIVDEVLAAAGLAVVLLIALPLGGWLVPDAVPRVLSAQPGGMR